MVKDRIDIINHIIEKYNYKFYLEIGVQQGNCIRSVKCPVKHGVDPNKLCPEVNFNTTSDNFFANFCKKNLYDIIFIDGHHNSEYVCRDLNNSLNHIKENGTIILHDCKPYTLEASVKSTDAYPPRNLKEWNGDSFKVIHSCVKNYKDQLECFTVDVDHGIGIVRKKENCNVEVIYDDSYSYEEMINNPEKEINLISINNFLEIF